MFNKKNKSDDLLNSLLNTLNKNKKEQSPQGPPFQGFDQNPNFGNGNFPPFPGMDNNQQNPFNQQQQQQQNQGSSFNPNDSFGFPQNNQFEQPNNQPMNNGMGNNNMGANPFPNFPGGTPNFENNPYPPQGQPGFQQPNPIPPMNNNSNFGFPPPQNQNTFDLSGNPNMGGFPTSEPKQEEIDERINYVDLHNNNYPNQVAFDNESNFNIEDPKTMYEAKKMIYELRERIHYLEATLVSLQTNYDNERKLAKKQNKTMNTYKKSILNVISELMQPIKYKYEKEHGQLGSLEYDELVDFLKNNLKDMITTEKQKNAKLFTLLKDMEEKNKRLENQLVHLSSNPGAVQNTPTGESNVYTGTGVSNIDKINAILGKKDEVTGGTNQNFPNAPEISLVKDTPTAPKESNTPNEKIKAIKEEIQNFNSPVNDVNLHPTEENILRAIGETGVDNNDVLAKQLESIRGSLNNNSFKTMLYNYRKKLIEKGIIETETLELPMKGYHKVELFKLTQKGINLYQAMYNKPPVESNMVKRLHQHSSLEHAFVIEKVAEQLQLNKYEVISDEKGLRFPVTVDNQQYHIEFDLIAKKGKDVYYIEVEMGTTTQRDFQDKCDKCYAFSVEQKAPIVIVSPSKKIAELNLTKVNNWMGSRGGFKKFSKEKSLKILLPYFEEVKSNKWANKLEIFIDLTK